MEFTEWINGKNVTKKKIIKENVLELEINQDKYILKRIDHLSEYLIQKDLISLNLPVFQKRIILLYSFEPIENILDLNFCLEERHKDKFYILMKKIQGDSLSNVLNSLSCEDLDSIIQIVFWSLKICWNKLEFVHLDLHLQNILVRKLSEPITIILDTDENVLEIKTNCLPFIIDFEESITKRYPNELNSEKKKTVLHDIWLFLGSLSLCIKDQEKYQILLNYLSYFIDPMTFQEKKDFFAKQDFRVLP